MAGEKRATASLTAVARRLSFVVEEDGPNRGAFVEKFQRGCNGNPGDPWCADFVSFVLDVAYFGKPPLKPTGSTVDMLAEATKKGYVPPGGSPQEDDLYFYLKDVKGTAVPHHVGIITSSGQFGINGIAGNTSPDGSSPEGTGVFEHRIPYSPMTVRLVRLPKVIP